MRSGSGRENLPRIEAMAFLRPSSATGRIRRPATGRRKAGRVRLLYTRPRQRTRQYALFLAIPVAQKSASRFAQQSTFRSAWAGRFRIRQVQFRCQTTDEATAAAWRSADSGDRLVLQIGIRIIRKISKLVIAKKDSATISMTWAPAPLPHRGSGSCGRHWSAFVHCRRDL